ncbi:hypothetical protein BGX28_001216 [Mortierella sp. GBA30]|nr:hypothetical protein BGX28_001216 [Mortierella sp. GBA30]
MWIPDEFQSVQNTSAFSWLQPHQLGQVVRIVGQPSEFRGSMQLTFQPGDSSVCTDPNDETTFRLSVLNKERSVYSKPVVLPDNVLQEAHRVRKAPATMLDRIREWLADREEFRYIDIENDARNREVAREVVQSKNPDVGRLQIKMRSQKVVAKCVHQLLSTGEIAFKDKEKMEFRVVKATSCQKRTAS